MLFLKTLSLFCFLLIFNKNDPNFYFYLVVGEDITIKMLLSTEDISHKGKLEIAGSCILRYKNLITYYPIMHYI